MLQMNLGRDEYGLQEEKEVSVIFGILGNIFAALLFVSPLGTFWRIIKNRSTEDFESIPYTVLLLSASLWTYYGIIKPDVLLVTINGFGSVLMVMYISIFIVFAPPKTKVTTAALAVVVNVGVLTVAILGTRSKLGRRGQVNTIGLLCDGVTIVSFASPLVAIKTVVTTQSVEFMPFWLTFFYFLVGTTWSIYGILIHDTFILVPNGIGFLLGVVQLVLYAWYRLIGKVRRDDCGPPAGSQGHRESLIESQPSDP